MDHKQEQTNQQAHAPYNFIPFSSKVYLLPEEEQLPAYASFDPGRRTGEIHVSLTADTPVFVSDGKEHFFRAPNGRFALPGSTVRGMARESMQILGFGLLRPGEDLEDYPIYYRAVADRRGKLTDGRKERYKAVLGIETEKTEDGKPVTVPRNVKAGYLRRENGKYELRPVKGDCLRVSRKHPDAAQFGKADARVVPVQYLAEGGKVKRICADGETLAPGLRRGKLLYTGRMVSKPNALYLFPEADEEAAPEPLPQEDEIAYREDWEARRNTLKDAKGTADFWKLPEEGQEKPVFYVRDNGHIYIGMTRFPRIGYPHPMSDGLPGRHLDYANGEQCARKEAAQAKEKLTQAQKREKVPFYLDLPHAIFGYATPERARRSRVSFGDFEAEGAPRELPPVRMILGEPKPSYYPGYVKDGETYIADGFTLRGYKHYWLKEPEKTDVPEGKERVGTALRPLPKGTRFHGVVRYRNLTEEELGLLLWSIRLEEGCYQSIGMGKPYGYGRMKISISGLYEYTPETLYDGLCIRPREAGSGEIEQLIDKYDSWMTGWYNGTLKGKKKKSIRELPQLREYFYMKSTIQQGAAFRYMDLEKGEYKKITSPLPTAAAIREELKPKQSGEMNIKQLLTLNDRGGLGGKKDHSVSKRVQKKR